VHAIIGWELELIAPKLCELIGMKYEGRNDEEGYTSEWLLELDKWLAKSDLDSLGIWTDGDRMFGADAALFIGFYVHDENFDWVTEISTPMKKFKEICALNKVLVNLEVSMNSEIIKKALRYKPNYICIVPENRKEITTEGGLNLKDNYKKLKEIIFKFKKSNIRTSLFINPNLNDIKLSKKLNVDCVEIHTGKLANYVKSHKNFSSELNRIKKSSKLASKLDIEVHAGHGLDYKTTKILTKIKEIEEFNIGHFIIGESIFYGLPKVIKDFKKIIKN